MSSKCRGSSLPLAFFCEIALSFSPLLSLSLARRHATDEDVHLPDCEDALAI